MGERERLGTTLSCLSEEWLSSWMSNSEGDGDSRKLRPREDDDDITPCEESDGTGSTSLYRIGISLLANLVRLRSSAGGLVVLDRKPMFPSDSECDIAL